MTQYEEADEYCPYCDNHYVSTACHSELPAACWLAPTCDGGPASVMPISACLMWV